jgi:hypothetical protein
MNSLEAPRYLWQLFFYSSGVLAFASDPVLQDEVKIGILGRSLLAVYRLGCT